MKKQVLGILVALFVFMVLLPAWACAADTVYAILYDDGTLVFQNGDTPEPGKTVRRTYTVDLDKVYNYLSRPWNDERISVRVVNFADTICPAYTACWFYWCEHLQRVENIQNLDTSNVTDMSDMFLGCSELTSLDVSHFNTANVTSMHGTFSDCSGLTSLDVSGFDTANVTDMSQMFFSCRGLTSLDVSGFDTANVTDMRYMFEACSGLTSLDVSHFNTNNVTYMQEMFSGCSGLKSLNVSNFNTINVTNMRHMFSRCSGLALLDLSGFNTAKATDMDYMFSGCNGLKTIYAFDKFTTASVANDRDMFYNCTSLIGGNGTKYNKSYIDRDYARIDTPSTPGYFTYKAAPAAYAITAVTPDEAAGTLSVTLTNPNSVTVAVSYFGANGQFMSANMRGVPADAGTVTLGLSAGARKACVMLFDGAYRPLCRQFEAEIS